MKLINIYKKKQYLQYETKQLCGDKALADITAISIRQASSIHTNQMLTMSKYLFTIQIFNIILINNIKIYYDTIL